MIYMINNYIYIHLTQQIKHSREEIIYHVDVKFTLQEWVNGLGEICPTRGFREIIRLGFVFEKITMYCII